jgi:amino acid transporter
MVLLERRTATTSPALPASERHRLTTIGGLSALSLDAMASVAYGPEAIVLVLAVAGAHGIGFTLPVSIAIVVLLAILVASYRQVIAAFPDGGGAYAVARRRLGPRTALVAAASLVIDYVLNVAVSIAAGVAALTSAFPELRDHTVVIGLGILALVTAVNLRGIATGARLFIAPTAIFVGSIVTVILVGLVGSAHDLPPVQSTVSTSTTVGILLLLKAFSAGCSALTGVEAIANATPQFRRDRVRRAQRAEVALGVTLGTLMLGIAVLVEKFDIRPRDDMTVLAQVTQESVGHGIVFYVVQFATVVLLALAANTSFGGLPQLMKVVADDHCLPHRLRRAGARGVYRDGVLLLAGSAAVLLVVSDGRTDILVPLFAIGVFIGFTIAQVGLVRHWWLARGHRWQARLALNGLGAVATAVAALVTFAMKADQGSPLVLVILLVLVIGMSRVRRVYRDAQTAERVAEGVLADALSRSRRVRDSRLVVVPVDSTGGVCRETLTRVSAFGDVVFALHVLEPDEDDDSFRATWDQLGPAVGLQTVRRSEDVDVVDTVVAWVQEASASAEVLVAIGDDDADPVLRAMSAGRGDALERALQTRTSALVTRVHCAPRTPIRRG